MEKDIETEEDVNKIISYINKDNTSFYDMVKKIKIGDNVYHNENDKKMIKCKIIDMKQFKENIKINTWFNKKEYRDKYIVEIKYLKDNNNTKQIEYWPHLQQYSPFFKKYKIESFDDDTTLQPPTEGGKPNKNKHRKTIRKNKK